SPLGGPLGLRRLGLLLLEGVVTVVAVVVLGEPKVNHRLAQRAAHWSSSRRDRTPSRRYCSEGRSPSTALPTRRCVAPHAIAASRSPLIPAETTTACGWSARTCSDSR